jgi:ParB-like chromosome segregation protein Spo0J
VTATAEPTTTASIEGWLDELGITWILEPDLELHHIDVAKSLANQARVGDPLIEDVVDRYRADYERGDTFPPLLARRTSPRAKLVLLGGNHRRAAAAAAGLTTHPAYIVECTDEAALTLMYGDNRRHGMPPSKTERCAQAVHLVDNGWTQAEAAAAVGVSQPALSNHLAVARTSRRASALGVGRQFDSMPGASKEALARVTSDPVFVEAAKICGAARLNVAETQSLAKRLRDARSEADAMRIIGDEQELHRERVQNVGAKGRAAGKGAVTPYGTLNGALARILDVHADQVVPPDSFSTERVRKRIKDAARRLMEIDQALGGRR